MPRRNAPFVFVVACVQALGHPFFAHCALVVQRCDDSRNATQLFRLSRSVDALTGSRAIQLFSNPAQCWKSKSQLICTVLFRGPLRSIIDMPYNHHRRPRWGLGRRATPAIVPAVYRSARPCALLSWHPPIILVLSAFGRPPTPRVVRA